MSTAAILTLGIVIGSWFVVPAPRWALVTLSASATLLMLATIFAVFPLPGRITMAASITAIVGHVISLALTLDTPPTPSAGDPPGRMLSSMDMRLMDDNQMQWEGFLVLRSVQMTLSSDTPHHVREFLSTDEYRAILSILLAAIGTNAFASYFWGA